MHWLKRHFTTLLLVSIGLVGVGLIACPSFSDWWNSFHQSRAVASYMEAVTDLDSSQYDEIIKKAEQYNRKLARSGVLWTMDEEQEEDYLAELNVNESGIMGYIDIPKIHITLPIYHGTDEAVLQIAVGHIEGTSGRIRSAGRHRTSERNQPAGRRKIHTLCCVRASRPAVCPSVYRY